MPLGNSYGQLMESFNLCSSGKLFPVGVILATSFYIGF